MAGQAWTVRELFVGRKKVMEAQAGSVVEVETPFRFSAGDAVYKVSSREAFTLSENACLRRLESVQRDKLPVRVLVSLHDGVMRIVALACGSSHLFQFALGPLEPARSGDMQAVLQGQFAETAIRLSAGNRWKLPVSPRF